MFLDSTHPQLSKISQRTNQGKRCQGRTPKQTWDEGYELYKKYVIEKMEVTDAAVVH